MNDTAKTQQHYYDFCEMLWNNFKCCDLPGTTQSLATPSAGADLITVEIYDKAGKATTPAATVQLKLGDLTKWKKKHSNTSGASGVPAASSSSSSSSSAQGASLFSLTASDVIDFIASSSAAKKAFKGRPAPGLSKYSVYVLKKMSDESAKLHSKRFKKYLRSRGDAGHPCCGRSDTYACIPLEPGVPFWLYSYTLCDTIAFVEKQQPGEEGSSSSSSSDTGGNTEFDAQFVTLKLVVGEEGVAETLRVPATLPAGVLCRAVNGGSWWGPHHHAVEAKHLKYYGLFYLSISQGWVPLDPEAPLAACGLLRNAVVAFKRKNVCELCYQCAVGPAAGLFESIKRVTNDYDGCNNGGSRDSSSSSGDDDNNNGGSDDGTSSDGDQDSGSGTARARSNLKILVSLDWTVKEATEFLQKWVGDTFGLSLNDAEKEGNTKKKKKNSKASRKEQQQQQQQQKKKKKKKEHKRQKHRATLLTEGIKGEDDNDESTFANGAHKVTDDEKTEDMDNNNNNNNEEEEEEETTTAEGEEEEEEEEEEEAPAVAVAVPPQLFYKGLPARGRIMEELRLSPGDVVELRKSDTALQFTVKYTPKSGIRHKHLARPAGAPAPLTPRSAAPGSELLEFDGEKVVYPEVRCVSLLLPQSSLLDSVELEGAALLAAVANPQQQQQQQQQQHQQLRPRSIPGSVLLSNYQLYFQSREGEKPFLLKIPHGLVQRIEKKGNSESGASVSTSISSSNAGAEAGTGLEDEAQGTLTVVCKDPRVFHFAMPATARRPLYDALYACCNCGITGVFAFAYRSPFVQNGWDVYSPEAEYRRLGVDAGGDCGWRTTTSANSGFALCSTYPELLAVPAAADDAAVAKEAAHRSKGRLPVLCWRDTATGASITRCSQPCTGLTGKASDTDQRYLELVRQTNTRSKTLYILDSRPKANALANRARGGGYEDTSGSAYPGCTLDFENIPNIHAVREGFEIMREIAQPSFDESAWYARLGESRWLDMARAILLSVRKGVALLHGTGTSLVIHCSDGWDRTSQCCALTELCLDPYYRTIRGLEVLIEKDWVSFGHKFQQRYAPGDLKPSDQRSPIFPQFVFCLYQLLAQFPAAFEFNEHLLTTILDELYTCRFGTFLFNSEKERTAHKVRDKTTSLWSYVNSNIPLFVNPAYAPKATPKVIYPDPSHRKLRLWDTYFFDWTSRSQFA